MGFWLLVRLAIAARQGRRALAPAGVRAVLTGSFKPTAQRETYWPTRIQCDENGELRAEGLSWHGSGDPFGFSRANGLIVRPPGAPSASTGDSVLVIPLERL